MGQEALGEAARSAVSIPDLHKDLRWGELMNPLWSAVLFAVFISDVCFVLFWSMPYVEIAKYSA